MSELPQTIEGAYFCIEKLQAEVTRLEAERDAMIVALEEIAQGKGPFSRDQMTHATNTIENMKQLAQTALTALRRRP